MKNIKIVYGRNGSDIHRRMRSKVADFAAHAAAEDRAFFIVPDQYTLTAERFLLAAVGEKALRNIRVVCAFLRIMSKGHTNMSFKNIFCGAFPANFGTRYGYKIL